MDEAFEKAAPSRVALQSRAYLCGDFYVVIEPLSAQNITFWTRYLHAMQQYLSKLGARLWSRATPYREALKGFDNALELYGVGPLQFIAYVSSSPRHVGASSAGDMARKAYDIEMCMTVNTTADLSFTTHMGIFRSPLSSFFDAGVAASIPLLQGVSPVQGENHARLSGWLHAKAALTFCSPAYAAALGVTPKSYMITCPLHMMGQILRSKGGRNVGTAHSGEEVRLLEKTGTKLFPNVKLMVGVRTHQFGGQVQPWVPRLVFADTENPAMYISLAKLADSHLEPTETASPSLPSLQQMVGAAVRARRLDAEDEQDAPDESDDF